MEKLEHIKQFKELKRIKMPHMCFKNLQEIFSFELQYVPHGVCQCNYNWTYVIYSWGKKKKGAPWEYISPSFYQTKLEIQSTNQHLPTVVQKIFVVFNIFKGWFVQLNELHNSFSINMYITQKKTWKQNQKNTRKMYIAMIKRV